MPDAEIVQQAERLLSEFYKTDDIASLEPAIDPVVIAGKPGLEIDSSRLNDHVAGIYDKAKGHIGCHKKVQKTDRSLRWPMSWAIMFGIKPKTLISFTGVIWKL